MDRVSLLMVKTSERDIVLRAAARLTSARERKVRIYMMGDGHQLQITKL